MVNLSARHTAERCTERGSASAEVDRGGDAAGLCRIERRQRVVELRGIENRERRAAHLQGDKALLEAAVGERSRELKGALETLRERDPKKIIPPMHGALLKNEQDVHLFERLVFMSRKK